MADPVRHLSPTEAARRLGVTVKALRLYEAKGLVTPRRTANGWRVYGPEAVARLHQILALKGLGLSLQSIAALLARDRLGLADVLALQEQALLGEQGRVSRALALVRRAKARVAAGATLSIDDLTALTQETTVTEKLTDQAWTAIFAPLAEKHYTAAERAALEARQLSAAAAGDIQRQWADIIAEVNRLMADGAAPESDAAVDMARRWKGLQDQFTQGDPVLSDKTRAMWRDAMADPVAAPQLPITPAIWDYVAAAGAAMRARAS